MASSAKCSQSESEFEKIADNIPGSEGPVFTRDGTFFMVAPEVEKDGKHAGQILTVDQDNGQKTVICEPNIDGHGGIPAGCQGDKANNIWVADMRLGILKVTKTGTYEQVAKKDSSGATLQGCNDCIYDYDGNLWVTAPAGPIAPAKYIRSSLEDPFGSVYCLTAAGQLVKVDSGYAFSNGIAVQHDQERRPIKLIVAETHTRSLWGYDIIGPGQVANKQLWGKLPGDSGGPDGMDFDADGNLIVANHGNSHLEVFGPSGGNHIRRVFCPFDKPSNVHFKQNSKELLITEHTNNALWKTEWPVEGAKQYCDL